MKYVSLVLAVLACLTLPVSPLFPAAPLAQTTPAASAAPAGNKSADVGERVPSEDALIKDLHSLGLINGKTNIFRSASPVRDLVKTKGDPAAAAALRQQADARMKHLFDLGVRTVISFENPDPQRPDPETGADAAQRANWIGLERDAAQDAGLAFISFPINNSGQDSLQTMTDAQVFKLVEAAGAQIMAASEKGGVLFHCAAGHDRTGIVAAYLRLKFEQWPVQQAIDEMRRLGHNWVKYSNNGGVSSWHEEHLLAIADMLKKPAN